MIFEFFPCVGPADDFRWGQVLPTPMSVGIVEVAHEGGGAKEIGLGIITRLSRGFNRMNISQKEMKEIVHTSVGTGKEVSTVLMIHRNETKINVVLRGQGALYIRRGKTFASLINHAGTLSGEIKNNDVLFLVSETAAAILHGHEELFFSKGLTPKEIADAIMIHFEQAGNAAVGSTVFVVGIKNDDPKPLEVTKQYTNYRRENIRKIFSFVHNKLQEKRNRVYVLVALLTVFFIISVVLGVLKQKNDKSYVAMTAAKEVAQQLFNEGITQMDSEPLKSRDKFLKAQEELDSFTGMNLPKGKDGKAIELLSKQIEDNLAIVSKVYKKDPQLFYDASFLQKDRGIDLFHVGAETMTIADITHGMIAIVSLKSKDAQIVAGGSEYATTKFIALNDEQLFVLSDAGITEFLPDNPTGSVVIPKEDGWDGFTTFGNNVYTLDKTNGKLYRYPAKDKKFGEKENYFDEDVHPDLSKTTNIIIDGSVWLGSSIGKIFRYTQGRDDPFLIRGIEPPLHDTLQVSVDADSTDVYVFDPEGQRVVVVTKEGMYKSQYVWPESFKPTSFGVSYAQKKILLLSEKKIYQISVE